MSVTRQVSNAKLSLAVCLTALAAVLLAPAPSFARNGAYSQSPASPQAGNLRVQVDLQSLAVRVTDKQGNDVKGLSVGDFTILEDGHPQKIAFFGADNVPTSLNVLVDQGGSMDSTGKLGSAEAIAARFLRNGRPADEISAMEFTDQMGPFRLLTEQQARNPSSVVLTPGTSRGSALYDALAIVLCHLNASQNLRQAVVVITDGVDQHSRLDLEQLIALVQTSRAQLFMIGSNSRPEFDFNGHAEKKLTLVSGHEIDNPAVVFDRLTNESGAESLFPGSEESLERALKKVSDLLQAQYTIAYYPTGDVRKFRRIQVKVKRPGVVVTTRRGVGSDLSAGASGSFFGGACEISAQLHPYPYESKVTESKDRISYHDDFSDAHTGWPNREGSRYVASGYELSNTGPSKIESLGKSNPLSGGFTVTFRQNVVAAYGPWWNDFRASAVLDDLQARRSASSEPPDPSSVDANTTAAGLVFRLNDRGYYALLLTGGGAKDLWFKVEKWQYRSNQQTDIISWTQTHRSESPEAGIKVAVECVGSQIVVFLNGTEVGRAKDDSYSQGYVGFILSGMGRTKFSDLTVLEQ